MDSIYKAKGFNDAKHMAAVPAPDTAKPAPRPQLNLLPEMWRDGLIPEGKFLPHSMGTTKDVNGNDSIFFVVAGKLQPPGITKKYIDTLNKFYKEHPTPRRVDSANDILIREKSTYLMNHIIVQLLNAGLTKDGAELSFKLDDKTFIVNDAEQPEEIRQKYFDEIIKPVNFYYNRMYWLFNGKSGLSQ